MGERVTFLERKGKTGETTAYIQTRKAWTPRDSSGQELPSHAFTSTHRKPSECHVQSPQSKTREAQTSELETHLQKASSERRAGRNSREAWKTSLFSTATKAIRKANIPLSPLPGEWSCSVTVFRAAKASLLVVERALPHLTIHTTASLPRSLQLCTCWPNWTLDAGYSWEHKHGHKHPCSYLFTFQPFLEQSRELENFLPVFQHRLEGTANIL